MTNDVIRAAATAVIVRNHKEGLETLLLRRHAQLKVGGGHWVFPGGTIDAEDYLGTESEQQAAQVAAVRETQEEAGLSLVKENFTLLSHWTTPPAMGRRFATWFFLVEGGNEPVVVDGEEMDDFCWAKPRYFLDLHHRGELALMPPTVVTLTELAACSAHLDAQRFYATRKVPFFEPIISSHNDKVCMLYDGDAGYSDEAPDINGPRNRCYLNNGAWHYEFSAE
ncbi:Uncharacterised protein [Zhongshania aliphaticivorans]|uniref:Nudix hydrolase domain-containing protein n=1 Tax=Zhongshania aliphaticivorans TaxID=1470434 RepID=A0A5S9NUI4_9GAMM|nr:NUDIX hydrolase [Zhongshania aliphaticivorans]CAA0094293.1 Uncharacterised protein [Zhongshania aliphaticivorans]CAA0112376.1 Uncharacterised protein [Zhongshania aliphaticivorans]